MNGNLGEWTGERKMSGNLGEWTGERKMSGNLNLGEWTKGMVLLDRTDALEAPLEDSFALDELLAKSVGEGGPPVCHLWRHPRAFVLGARDARLPRAAEAVRLLHDAGYEAIVRGSGGAAVPLDEGVVNVSLLLPIGAAESGGFRDDFLRMVRLIGLAMAGYGLTVRYGEVEGSYCPGDYDLHLDGFKFCGIAQRRQVKAMIVTAFVNVDGSGDARAAIVRDFYDVAGVGSEPGAHPDVIAGRMTSLRERGFEAEAGVSSTMAFVRAIVRTLGVDPAAVVTGAANGAAGETVLAGETGVGALPLPGEDELAAMRERLATRYPLP